MPDQHNRSRPLGLIVGCAVVAALLGSLFLMRGEPRANLPPQPSHERARFSEHIRQRLRRLRAAHPGMLHRDRHERREARAAIPTAPAPVEAARPMPRPTALLAEMGNDIPSLAAVALHDADPERRLIAVVLLSASENPQVIPILAQAMSDPDEDVRMAAVESLSDFTGEAPVDAIESALNDPSADIRYEALNVLADIPGERARQAAQRALHDPDADVRSLAAEVLALDESATEPAQPAAGAPQR